jgi:uncharacterized protein (DUF433 family)
MAHDTPLADPETIYIQPICGACKDSQDERLWWDQEKDAACRDESCPNKPVAYIRADLFDARLQQMEDNAIDYNEARELRIALLINLLNRVRDRLDAFADADLIEEINAGAWRALDGIDPERADVIDWSRCPDVESVPGRCGGAWVAKDSRVMVQDILNNAEECSAEEVADMFTLPLEQVRRVLLFAYQAELDSLVKAHRKSPNLPGAYIYIYRYRAGVLVAKVAEIARALRPRPTRGRQAL